VINGQIYSILTYELTLYIYFSSKIRANVDTNITFFVMLKSTRLN